MYAEIMLSAEKREPVLVIDDEPDMCRLLEFNLLEEGFAPVTVTTAETGLLAAQRMMPVVVILDLMLPDLPGTEACRKLRASPELADVGILMLTARGEEEDRVVGFEVGADDYVVKPFSVREVVLRVRALARRCRERRAARTLSEPAGKRASWRGVELDTVSHRVFIDGKEISLRPMEFKLLALFLEHPNQVFSREQLLEHVWEITAEVNTRTVDTHVRRLRQRLGPYGDAIVTVHGFGYRLQEE